MAERNWQERRDVNCAALMGILRGLAKAGKPCPDANELALTMKLTPNMVTTLFDLLRLEGRIDWKVIHCGKGIGRRRWVQLLKEGLSTAKPQTSQRSYIKAPRDDSALARAKVILQRRGCYVWDAPVSEGLAFQGMVKVDRKILEPAAVIALAGL